MQNQLGVVVCFSPVSLLQANETLVNSKAVVLEEWHLRLTSDLYMHVHIHEHIHILTHTPQNVYIEKRNRHDLSHE